MKFGCPQAIFNLSMLGASDAIGSSPRSRRCAQYSSPFAATIRRRARRHLPARRHRTHGRDRQSSAPRRDVASLREPLPPARLRAVHCVNKHRSWTPGLRAANLLICFVNLADNRGPDRRRPGRISSRYIKALRSWGPASVLIHIRNHAVAPPRPRLHRNDFGLALVVFSAWQIMPTARVLRNHRRRGLATDVLDALHAAFLSRRPRIMAAATEIIENCAMPALPEPCPAELRKARARASAARALQPSRNAAPSARRLSAPGCRSGKGGTSIASLRAPSRSSHFGSRSALD
jgi:hypothetical protein